LKSPYQKFAKDTLVIGIANVLVALSRIILLPLLTKTLGAHDYGIWAQAQVTISLVLGGVGLGLPYALTRFLPAKTDEGEIREEFWSVFSLVSLTTFAVSLILIAAAGPIAGAFFEGSTRIVRITGLIILTWSLDSALLSLFRAFRQMKRYALFVVGDAYLELAVIAFLVLKGHALLSLLWTVLAVRILVFIPLFFLINSQVRIKRPHFSKIKEYLSFGLPTIPGNLASWVVASSDRYIIGYFLGASSVGVYSATYALGNIPIMLATVLGFVLPPTLSQLYDEGRIDEVRTHLSYSLKYLLMMAIPFVCGAAVLSNQILGLFSTTEIASQGYYVVPPVALATLILCICVPFGQTLLLMKKTKVIGLAYMVAALINLGLNLLIVPIWGILGAAITTLIAYSVLLDIELHYSRKDFRFDIDWHFIIKSLVASGIMTFAIWLMHPQSNLTTITTIIVGMVIYGVALLLLKGFTKDEMLFFRRLLQQRTPPGDSSDDKIE